MKKRKLLEKVLSGSKNIQFNELVTLIEAFGFTLFFKHPDLPELINIQNKNYQVSQYQIRQFLLLVEQYNLT